VNAKATSQPAMAISTLTAGLILLCFMFFLSPSEGHLDLVVVLFSVFRRFFQAAEIAGAKQHSTRQGLSPFFPPENAARDAGRVNRVQPEMPDDGKWFW